VHAGDPAPAGPSLAGRYRRQSRRDDRPPGPAARRHWPDRPEIIAGRDLTAAARGSGSTIGVCRGGAQPARLARSRPGQRSRASWCWKRRPPRRVAAAEALSHLDPRAYRTFNLIVADTGRVLVAPRGREADRGASIADGLSLIAAGTSTSCRAGAWCSPRRVFAPPHRRSRRDDWRIGRSCCRRRIAAGRAGRLGPQVSPPARLRHGVERAHRAAAANTGEQRPRFAMPMATGPHSLGRRHDTATPRRADIVGPILLAI